MRILGFDPGSADTGWCELDVRGGAGTPITPTYFDSGTVPSSFEGVGALLRARPDVVAIEKISGYAFGAGKGPGVVAALIATSWVAGMIAALAHAEGLAIVELSALEWRRVVLGKPSASDQLIADVLPRLVHAWPKRSNVHTRDAGGCALGVAWRLNGRMP